MKYSKLILHYRHESSSKSLWDEDEIEMSLRNHLLVLCGTPAKAEQESKAFTQPTTNVFSNCFEISQIITAIEESVHPECTPNCPPSCEPSTKASTPTSSLSSLLTASSGAKLG